MLVADIDTYFPHELSHNMSLSGLSCLRPYAIEAYEPRTTHGILSELQGLASIVATAQCLQPRTGIGASLAWPYLTVDCLHLLKGQ